MRSRKSNKPKRVRLIGGKTWAQRIHEIPEATKVYVRRMMSNQGKIWHIQKRLLYSQYKPRYRKAKNSNQARAIYLLKRGINPNKTTFI